MTHPEISMSDPLLIVGAGPTGLTAALDREGLLDTYEPDRMPVMRDVLSKTAGLTRMIGTERPWVRSLFRPHQMSRRGASGPGPRDLPRRRG